MKLKKILAVVAMVGCLLVVPKIALADGFSPICDDPDVDPALLEQAGCGKTEDDSLMKAVARGINTAISVVGIVSVVVIVFGGQRYIVSAGDASKVKQAKDMIVYAIVGLLVAGLAWGIVNFVVVSIFK